MVNISKGCDEDGPDEAFAESRRLVQGDNDSPQDPSLPSRSAEGCILRFSRVPPLQG